MKIWKQKSNENEKRIHINLVNIEKVIYERAFTGFLKVQELFRIQRVFGMTEQLSKYFLGV